MFIRRLTEGLRRQDWAAVLVEVLVVMVGLVAAFQVDRWWEGQRDRASAQGYRARLIAEVEEDIPALEYAISLAEVRRDFGDLLAAVGAEPSLALEQPGVFLAAVGQAAFTYTPTLSSHTFDDLRSTGNLALIRDPALKRALHDYHDFDASQRQFIGLNLMIEFRYFELAAGVLTLDQHRFIQDRWFVVNERRLPEVREARPDPEGVRAAALRLAEDTELLDWLPRVSALQTELIHAHGDRLARARALLEQLRAGP